MGSSWTIRAFLPASAEVSLSSSAPPVSSGRTSLVGRSLSRVHLEPVVGGPPCASACSSPQPPGRGDQPGSVHRALNPEDLAFRSTVFARRTLEAGFTTVRDLGGTGVNTALRDAVNQGLVVGPRIPSTHHSLAVTGGHGDPTNGFRRDLMWDPGPQVGVVDGNPGGGPRSRR